MKYKIISFLNCSLIYVYHLCSNNLEFFDLYTRNLSAQFAYFMLFISLVYSVYNGSKRFDDIFDILAKYWLLFNCLIHPTHNLIVLALWQFKEYILHKYINHIYNAFNEEKSRFHYNIMFFYLIINQSCYFTQGNSNSLNTIQVASGFVGINEMNMFIVGLLLTSATYSSNIYWWLISVKHLSLIGISKK